MSDSAAAHNAMDFLVSKIAQQAETEGVPLSEVERKMLYFSETAWTLHDMARVSQEFDREHEQAAYEEKIAKLIRNLRAAHRKADTEESETWTNAVRTIRTEDRYLRVMLAQAESPGLSRGHVLRLAFITAIGCCIVLVILLIVFQFKS